MFQPLGLFKSIPCPKRHDCNLQNCIFSHELNDHNKQPVGGEVYDPFSAGEPELEPPPSKRRRITSPIPGLEKSNNVVGKQSSISLSERSLPAPPADRNANKTRPVTKSVAQPDKPATTPTKTAVSVSIKRPISPPPKRETKAADAGNVEKLVPRPVGRAPALLKVRMSFVEVLYKQMKTLNGQMAGAETTSSDLLLSDQQMIKWVLDEEEQAATKLSSDIYRNAVSQTVLQLKKMKPDGWKAFVTEKFNATESDKNIDQITSGMSSEELIQVLKYLRTNLTGLDSHGYVTKAPSATDIQKAKEAIKTGGGYEACDRCGVRFQVFPGRDEQGRLTTKGECYFHWAKLNRTQYQKTDHITGQSQASFPCCGQLPGSEGCTQAPTHVFKVADPKRLAVLLQFEQTPAKSDEKNRGPVAFDCEMAYTTYGMEVVRVTAVSWPKNKELLDVLVRPYGEILDLNTRFSGVTQEQFTNALPYDATYSHGDDTSEEGEAEPEPLRKVDTPAAARQLMFELLTPETPLIGHAIDNDLNTCRIIHPFVVDTVLLYPHPRGLPMRYGLKLLTSKYLQRSIQNGGEAGHDSKEDSIATGDLVKLKVAEKWQMMRLQGWKIQEGTLRPPGRL